MISKIFRRGLLLLLTWMVIHCTWATIVGLRPFKGKADVAIVLGNQVYKDGTLSPWLRGRVDAALNLYQNKQVKKIFVSGGIGDTKFPEGDGMRNYLVQKGVPDSVIIVDNLGDNSYHTAKNFITLNEKEHFDAAVVVSSYYHILRCKYIIKKLGYENVASDYSRSFFWQDMIGLVREFPAFYKYMLVY